MATTARAVIDQSRKSRKASRSRRARRIWDARIKQTALMAHSMDRCVVSQGTRVR